MLSSSYSVKYKQLQRQQIQNLRQVQEEERSNSVVRSKKLQQETTKRRKALAIKRKLEQAKEERRRQEILARRREEIKVATERFQRLNRSYTPKTDAEIKAALVVTKPPVPLEDALRAVRGSPQPSQHYHSTNYYRQASPSSSIRSSPRNQGIVVQRQYSPDENNYNGYYEQGKHQNYNYTAAKRSPPNQTNSRTPSATSINKHDYITNSEKQDGVTNKNKSVQLHDHSLRNLTNSRSLFEQKLENQQQANLDKQKASLAQFNQTLNKELNENTTPINTVYTSESSLAADSLESNKFNNDSKISNNDAKPGNGRYVDSALKTVHSSNSTSSTFMVHRSSNSPTVAVVQPSVVRKSPPSPSSTQTNNHIIRPYNKNNYDLHNNQSENSEYVYDSLEGSPNNEASKSNLEHYLGKFDDNKGAMNGARGSGYNGAVYQEATVGYASGVDLSYLKPGFNSGYNYNQGEDQHQALSQHSGGSWITPSNTDIDDVVKYLGSQTTQNSTLVTNVKPLTMRSTATKATVPTDGSGYYLHSNNNEYVAPQNEMHNKSMNGQPYFGKSSVNGAYSSSHYTSTSPGNTIGTYTNTNYTNPPDHGQDEVDAVPFHGSHYHNNAYANNFTTTNVPYGGKVGEQSNEPNNFSDFRQEDNTTNLYTQEYQIETATDRLNSNVTMPSTNGAYKASVYSLSGGVSNHQNQNQNNTLASKSVPTSVQVSVSSISSTSVANTNNSNPTILPKYSVVYSNNTSQLSTSLNSRKPPVPVPRSSIVNSQTPKDIQNSQKLIIPQTNGASVPKLGASKPSATTYNQDPSKIPRPKNPVNVTRDIRNTNEKQVTFSPRSQEDSSSDVEPESKPEPVVKKVIKGILKKPSSATLPRRADTFGVRGESNTGRKQRSMSAHARVSIRDSVEVTRQHKTHKKRRKKKMVRFVDMVYTNDSETDDDTEEESDDYIEEQQTQDQDSLVSRKPPTRPVSAKIGATKSENNTTRGRAVSAGIQRRNAFHRPHPPSEPPSGRAVMGTSPHRDTVNRTQGQRTTDSQSNGSTYNNGTHQAANSRTMMYSSGHDYMNNNGTVYTTTSNGITENSSTLSKSQNGAVYDVNGMRLDRTPTDEEINWLWDKVRTCLNKEDTSGAESNSNVHRAEANQYNMPPSRQQQQQQQYNSTSAVNTKYIDGNSIAPQFRTQTRIAAGSTNTPTRKVNMDTLSSYSRRASLLNQRKLKEQGSSAGGNILYHQQGDGGSGSRAMVQTSVKALSYQQPVPSTAAPVHGGVVNGYSHDVTESMAAFLAGEQLASKSISDSQLEQAMQEAQSKQAAINSTKPSQKAPSALSIEEQRLMQSLERLNERLKVKGTDLDEPSSNAGVSNINTGTFESDHLIPRPPNYHHGGFKGHAPLSSNHQAKRFINSNGSVARHSFRVSSAGPLGRTSSYGNTRPPYF